MSLFVATPCYGAQVCLNYHSSMIALMAEFRGEISFGFIAGESLVPRARNELVARFLDSPRDELLFVDADIGFHANDVLRLLDAPYPVAAGVYRLKGPRGQNGGYAADPAMVGPIGPDGFAPIKEAPTGFMRIRRHVFQDLAEVVPWYRSDGIRVGEFFRTMICPDTGRYVSEDYAFCRDCAKVGIPIYIDVNSDLNHQGSAMFTGDFGEVVAETMREIEQAPASPASP